MELSERDRAVLKAAAEVILDEQSLMHYGVKRRSGRYPWGSGDDPFQHGGDFLARVEELQSMGKSEKEIANELKMSTTDDTLRQNSTRPYDVEFHFNESWDGYTKTAIFEAKTAIFEAGPVSIVVALTEDRCTIPAECLKHGSVKLQIGIYGVKGEERKGTIWCLAMLNEVFGAAETPEVTG